MESLPNRPPPARPLGEVVRDWIAWFGLMRLVVTAVSVIAIGAGAYWLLRPPATPVENALPYATTTSSPPTAVSSTAAVVTDASAPSVIVVYVAGAVAVPGVYELPTASRVHEALDAAGGLAADADPDALNLAAVVSDGDRVFVPRVGQTVPLVVTPSGGGSGGGSGGSSADPAAPININQASADQLDELPGIGPATAAAIVAQRDESGPFASVDDLLDVRGIGPAKLDAIRALVTV